MTNEDKSEINGENNDAGIKKQSAEEAEILEVEAIKTGQKPEEEILRLKEQIAVLEDKSLRAMAEVENTRVRCNKQIDEARSYAIFNFARDLIGVMDNLTRAIEYAPKESNEQLVGVIDGVVMTKNELETVFNRHGLQSIKPAPGEKFDYNLHSAISQIATDEYDQDSIAAVMQVGYKIKERLLRPAAVSVAKKHNKSESS